MFIIHCRCLGRIWPFHRVYQALFDRFQRTNIDLSLPWRFANLPNNAKLEIVTCTRKQVVTESQVSYPLVSCTPACSMFCEGYIALYVWYIHSEGLNTISPKEGCYDDDCQSTAPSGCDLVFYSCWLLKSLLELLTQICNESLLGTTWSYVHSDEECEKAPISKGKVPFLKELNLVVIQLTDECY